MKKLCLTAVCFFLLFGVDAKADSVWPVEGGLELLVKWKNKSSNIEFNKNQRREFVKDCQSFANHFKLSSGAWGFGLFSKVSCTTKGNLSSKYVLEITTDDESVKLSMKIGDKTKRVALSTKFQYYAKNMKFLKSKELSLLLAYAILDEMPTLGGVNSAKLKADGKIVGSYPLLLNAKELEVDVPEAPERLILYRLRYDERLGKWQTVVIGTTKGAVFVDSKSKRTATWGLSPETVKQLSSGVVWFHSTKGRATNQEELRDKVEEALEPFAEITIAMKIKHAFDASLMGGYVGVRYGAQTLMGSGLLEKAAMLGVLTELRGGPLEGLRYYYDVGPEVKRAEKGSLGQEFETTFGWSRHTLGFSFGLDLDFFIDRVDLIPKVGLWSFKSILPIEMDEEGSTVDVEEFSMSNATSFALELGIEIHGETYLLRGWAARDSGRAVKKSAAEVTSTRAGFDAYYLDGPQFSMFSMPFHMTFFGFYLFENLYFKKGDVTLDTTYGYAGLGTAVSW